MRGKVAKKLRRLALNELMEIAVTDIEYTDKKGTKHSGVKTKIYREMKKTRNELSSKEKKKL